MTLQPRQTLLMEECSPSQETEDKPQNQMGEFVKTRWCFEISECTQGGNQEDESKPQDGRELIFEE